VQKTATKTCKDDFGVGKHNLVILVIENYIFPIELIILYIIMTRED